MAAVIGTHTRRWLRRHWLMMAAVAQFAVVLLTFGRYGASSGMTYAEALRHSDGYLLEHIVLRLAALALVAASAFVALVPGMRWFMRRACRPYIGEQDQRHQEVS